ncbi:hypothetical protein [Natronococcus jeotgali]|uniref:Transposase n=1 Tax=Natronococcus jeotgali DSM 18795 TaxID=1227498 RepID=L9XH85_9EURY|nr:hypothetical protein [Natronococcus jeotgali]ELY60018.1 Transposase [Natronococcus jeotgali DSM 18795]
MEDLDEISVEELHETLNSIEGKKPIQRLLVATVYKSGVTQIELPTRYQRRNSIQSKNAGDSYNQH